ncbi:putative beta-1,4-mannosyltransferase [Lineolata rhizophorae]|uniref:Chitobiosyldiphosphodolichol beta-mannosyltransferase n=1 Tax=Lineolata rhizophorae TaxID=578093 RepID=A0A6A6P0C8_9PEZI|nr:putative beta-1,4-mannosyltransferase [Lineolata rhizophorae]
MQLNVEYVLGIALVLSTLFCLLLLALPSQYDPRLERSRRASSASLKGGHRKSKSKISVQVVVLGDIGRSPRMQYHALSIAKHGARVDIIGYKESDVHPEIQSDELINVVPIPPLPKRLRASNRLLFVFTAPFKILWQVLSLYYVLGYGTKPAKWMLVQNPPSIPTLALAWFVCFFRNTRLVIDWHNFGYSILALKLGPSHPLVRISARYEAIFSRFAFTHFAVTDAMARLMKEQYNVIALPLHDRPPMHFQPLTQEQRDSFLGRLPETAKFAEEVKTGGAKIVVSSTSWTADEDFSILLDALVAYSSEASLVASRLPRIIAIITGKGPQKEHYLSRIKSLTDQNKLSKAVIQTAWLSASDYALLLGAADLGVSLHTSSSGVDLPMKVVDMFGTGLPVVGWSDFEAWPELVQEGVNGRGFKSSDQLKQLLVDLLNEGAGQLDKLREGALRECGRRWDEEWDPVAGRVLGLAH